MSAEPIALILVCPRCGERHVDRGPWAIRAHRTHLCESCSHEWRPSEAPTVGVEKMPSVRETELDYERRRLSALVGALYTALVLLIVMFVVLAYLRSRSEREVRRLRGIERTYRDSEVMRCR